MRTTLALEPDVAAEVEAVRQREGVGISEAVRLVRAGMAWERSTYRYVNEPVAMNARVDVSDIGQVLDLLDHDRRA